MKIEDGRLHPRGLAEQMARVCGYFWLPCPICGERFAGFEWESGHTLALDDHNGTGVCPKASCGEECRRRNAARRGQA